jgi:hypothetical protein
VTPPRRSTITEHQQRGQAAIRIAGSSSFEQMSNIDTARKEHYYIMTDSPDIKMSSDKGPDGAGEEGSKDTDCELEPCRHTSSLDKLI